MKTVLVPYDYSKNALTALRYAIRLCKYMKTELVVFHCTQLSAYIIASSSATEEQMKLLLRDDAAFKSKKLMEDVKMAYKYLGYKKIPDSTKLLVESNPFLVENIIEASNKYHADLIVMGTHGATGLNRFFFGSNTANLISRSTIPVLAIPEKYRYKKIDNIVFSSDLENLEQELKRLIPFAKAVESNIDILYLDYGIDVEHAAIVSAKQQIKKSNYKKIKLVTKKVTIEFSLIRHLKKYLQSNRGQWLVMFTREQSFWNKILLGGKTESMSYSLKLPLLSFKKWL